MGLRSDLFRRVIYPAVDRVYGRSTFKAFEAVRRLRVLPPEAARAERETQLRTLLLHAWDDVPFYREHWTAEGVERGDLIHPDTLQRLPVVTKVHLREHQHRMLAENMPQGRLKVFSTSGSTGIPVTIFENPRSNAWRRAVKWHFLDWWGIRIGDRGAAVLFEPVRGLGARFTRRLGFALNNCNTFLNAGRLGDSGALTRFWRQMARRRVDWLYGYTSALTALARFGRTSGLAALVPLHLRLVVPTAEVLYEDQRREMTEGFGCPVANEYGCSELGDLAFECPLGSLHVAEETYVLDVGEPRVIVEAGVAGPVAVTHLRKTSMPLIRYLLGDIIHKVDDRCPCGRHMSVLRSVVGRVSDLMIGPDGKAVHTIIFDWMMDEFSGRENPTVSAFRIVQLEPAVFEFLAVPGAAWTSDTAERIPQVFRKTFGPGCVTKVRVVSEIPPDPSGKMRYFISRVPTAT